MSVPVFKSRAEAFDDMFTTLCEQGTDIMKAAEKAEIFAGIITKNRSLPDAPKKFIEQCADVIKEVSTFKKEYPEAWELVGGLLGGVIGFIAGTKAENDEEENRPEQIDFDKLE